VEQKDRYDEHGNYDEQGRYDRSGNYVFTPSERTVALLIGATLLALTQLLGSVLHKLPYSGVIDTIVGIAILFAFLIAVIGRLDPDGD
jgi:uncharacterized membrane protein YccC